MKLHISDTYSDLSKLAADTLVTLLHLAKSPLLCTASGDSPAGLYKELVALFQSKTIDTTTWSFVGLDEWVGLNGNDSGSCRYHLNEQLFGPLQLRPQQLSFFDGRANDPDDECQQVERFIARHGGIEIMIAGVGMNGHVGMNEPGSNIASHSHVHTLDPITQQVGQKYFKKEQPLSKGITLGLANFMESHHVFILISGEHKAAITKQFLEGPISNQVPASLLRKHTSLHVFLDKAAASGLSKT